MLATSAALTVVNFFSLRMRPEALRPVKWRLAVWPRKIFPAAVILKRLRAPRCVFNFIFGFDAFLGISKPFLHSFRKRRKRDSSLRFAPFRMTNRHEAKYVRVTAIAARRKLLAPPVGKSLRLSWAPEAQPEHYLPCAA